jgi:hypothetical protein
MPHPQKWLLVLERPEAFPTLSPYAGRLSYFYITDELARQPPPRDDFPFKDQYEEWLCLSVTWNAGIISATDEGVTSIRS